MPFLERAERLDRRFKWAITLLTVGVAAALLGGTSTGRYAVESLTEQAKQTALRQVIGLEPSREEIDSLREIRRRKTEADTLKSLTRFYNETSPEMRRMFDVAGMSPETGLIVTGRATNGFLLSSKVFERDSNGRSYRLRPNMRSVWLRQVTLHNGPFGLFLVPDTPEVREASVAAGAIVDEVSRQSTNSWGLRGPEPNPNAEARGIVLGDSFMEGMFNDDEHTPPLDLERELSRLWGCSVSIVNTGHIGYAPEQYYHSLLEYGEKFPPDFVVVSVCPNDFGDGDAVLLGKGDDWDEAKYWLGQIQLWCRGKMIPCLQVIVPVDRQILGARKEGYYPGQVSNIFEGSTFAYLNPFDIFVDEHLKLIREGTPSGVCPLFNGHINDNHFSPRGSKLWAEIVARRVDLLMKQTNARRDRSQDREPSTEMPN